MTGGHVATITSGLGLGGRSEVLRSLGHLPPGTKQADDITLTANCLEGRRGGDVEKGRGRRSTLDDVDHAYFLFAKS